MVTPLAVGQTYFNERYPLAAGYSGAVTVLPLAAGGYWITGAALITTVAGPQALFLQRLTAAGALAGPIKTWQQPDINYYSAFGNALLPLADGGMTLIGSSDHWVNGTRVVWGNLWRFTPQGDTLWLRSYTAANNASMILRGGCRLPDGGYALVGEYNDPTQSTGTDVLLLRTDSLGHELWRRTYHQDRTDGAGWVLPTDDGGLLLSGGFYPFSAGPSTEADGLLIKVDSLGIEEWRTTYGGSWIDLGGPVLPTPDGGYVVGGTSSNSIGPFNQWETRPTLFWFDSVGTLLRERAYGPGRVASSNGTLLPLADGGYLLAGQTADTTDTPVPGGGYPEGYLLRVCADGDSVWYRTYKNLTGGYSRNYLRDVRQAPDGGFVGAGFLHVYAPDTGTPDAWAFKTDADGYLQAGGAPPTVVCTPVGLPHDTGAADAGHLNVWPNPAPDGRYTVHLPTTTATAGPATLTLLDALGCTLWRAVARPHQPTPLDLSRHPPGVYLLRTQTADGRTFTNRLLR